HGKVHAITAPFGLPLERDDGKGQKLTQEYPAAVGTLFGQHPGGRPAFRSSPDLMKRALGVFSKAGVEQVEFFLAAKVGTPGAIYTRGADSSGALVLVVLAAPVTAERKAESGEIVEDVTVPVM